MGSLVSFRGLCLFLVLSVLIGLCDLQPIEDIKDEEQKAASNNVSSHTNLTEHQDVHTGLSIRSYFCWYFVIPPGDIFTPIHFRYYATAHTTSKLLLILDSHIPINHILCGFLFPTKSVHFSTFFFFSTRQEWCRQFYKYNFQLYSQHCCHASKLLCLLWSWIPGSSVFCHQDLSFEEETRSSQKDWYSQVLAAQCWWNW